MATNLKKLVRARMEKTGERHEQALRHVRSQVAGTTESEPESGVNPRATTLADTAFSIAVVRAEEATKPESERLFADPLAARFIEAGGHTVEATQRYLELPFFRDGVRLRTRAIDDAVRDAIAAGAEQLVLLGAGFDTRGHRQPEVAAHRVTVFEIDTAHQLARKRRLLGPSAAKTKAKIVYVPFEFELAEGDLAAKLTGALEAAGFRRGVPTVFVWEGVIGYVDMRTIDASLRFAATAGGAGSRLVFTYTDLVFDPETPAAAVQRAGFTRLEEATADALWRRYWGTEPHPNAVVMKVGVATT